MTARHHLQLGCVLGLGTLLLIACGSNSPTAPRCSGLDYSGTASVRGRVTYGGAGIAGAAVTIGSRQAVTSADGSFLLADVTPGPQTLLVGPFEMALSSGEVHVLRGDNLLVVPVVRGLNEGILAGRALDSCTGRPLAGVIVSLAGKTATTNADGLYELNDLCCGTLPPLSASKSGYQPYTTALGRLYNSSRWLDLVMLKE